MSHTYAQNVIHVVFSTKERRKLVSAEFRPRLWAYTAGICKNLGIFTHGIGGMDDHIHLLLQIPPAMPLAKAVMGIKANSSRWARAERHDLEWQRGYGAFSVSASLVPAVLRYIRNQDAHHKKMKFRGRIPSPVEKAWRRIRSEICLRLRVTHLRCSEMFSALDPNPHGLG